MSLAQSFQTKLKKVDGKVIFPDSKTESKYKMFLAKLPEGEEVRLEIQRAGEDWTLQQIRYCHLLCRETAKITGETFEEVKKRFKCVLGLCIHYKVGETIKEKIISLVELDKEDMIYLIDQWEHLAEEAGCVIYQKFAA